MVSRHDPAALVVVAFWVAALVIRAEQSGYWFLAGLGKELSSEIQGRIRDLDEDALKLLEG